MCFHCAIIKYTYRTSVQLTVYVYAYTYIRPLVYELYSKPSDIDVFFIKKLLFRIRANIVVSVLTVLI